MTPGNSQPSSPAVASHKKKKGGGFLALFGCCGVPDHANGLPDEPIHKLDKVPQRPATASRRPTPSEQPSGSKTQLFEKDPPHNAQSSQDGPKNGKRVSGTSTQDQSTVGDRDGESKQTTLVGAGSSSPVITVEVPHASSVDVTAGEVIPEKDGEGDVRMTDADSSHHQGTAITTDEHYPAVPPPPPGPVPAVPNAPTTTLVENPRALAEEKPQKFLLPPQAPEFKGKKCLVLDLDETLVHSSFKASNARRDSWDINNSNYPVQQILHQADFTIPVEIEGNYHNVYVIKRPGVDQFMKRVGELYEVVVFTASVSKVR